MTVPVIRSSERVTFERCKARWWWSYREGLVRKHKRLDALWFGEGVHLAFALWYTGPGTERGIEPVETWERWAEEGVAYFKTTDPTDEQVAEWTDAAVLGRVMLEGHRARYGRDDHMHIISPEHTWHLDLPWPERARDFYDVTVGATMARLVGTYDKVFRDLRDDTMWLGETKTAKAITTRHLGLDSQAGTYWATATGELQRRGTLGPKEFLAGIEYDFLRKALPDDRPRDAEGYATNKPVRADYVAALTELVPGGSEGKPWDKYPLKYLEIAANFGGLTVLGERSKVQPPALFLRHTVHRTTRERRAQLLRAQDQAFTMELYRDGSLPITKNTTADCRFCEFQDMCELQERGGNWEDFRDATYVVQDPYASHRKSAAEES